MNRCITPDVSPKAQLSNDPSVETIFTTLYTTYYQRVYRRVSSLVANPQHAEDVTQEVFLKLWRVLCASDSEYTAGSAFLYRMTTNKAIDFWRSEKKRTERVCPLNEEDAGEAPQGVTVEDAEIVRQALSQLKEEDAFFLVAWASGFSIDEIAMRRGTSTGSIKARMYRARHVLAQYMHEEAA